MPQVRFATPGGEDIVVEGKNGDNLMLLAKARGVSGIVAECGGGGACGTCHVVVDPQWADRTGRPNEFEQQMLDFLDDRKATSRLACQIVLTDAMDGLLVGVPAL